MNPTAYPTAPIGRPAKISLDDVVRAGVEIGLDDLSIKRVADRLRVTAGALYHHVAGVDALRSAVGDHIVSTIELDSAADGPVDELVNLGLRLRSAEQRHPGVGTYLADNGRDSAAVQTLIATAAARIEQHGISGDDARVVTGIAANLSFAFASREAAPSHDAPPGGTAPLLAWILHNTASGLIADLANAPWKRRPTSGSF